MPVHIYQQGRLSKRADEGLTFEQQMGTMTSARVSEQFPILAPYVVGFELIKKDENGTYGIGTMVYMMGNQAFYIPSFYNHGRFRTGEMMILRDQQQFIPATEGLISYMKARYDKGLGKIFPSFGKHIEQGGPGSAKVKEDEFPIGKSASLDADTTDIFDTALKMGKQASAQLIDIITSDTRIFNDFVDYYGIQKVADFKDAFEKQHAPEPKAVTTWTIDPLDKQASVLSEDEHKMLTTFGFLIKTAKREFADVSTISELSNQFVSCTDDGVYDILADNGDVNRALVLHMADDACVTCGVAYTPRKGFNTVPDAFLHPSRNKGCDVILLFEGVDGSYYQQCSYIPTGRKVSGFKMTFDKATEIGETLKDKDTLEWGDIIVCPDLATIKVRTKMIRIKDGDSVQWTATCGDERIVENDVLKAPRRSGSIITIPEGCVVVHDIKQYNMNAEDMPYEEREKKIEEAIKNNTFNVATPTNVTTAILNYINKRYETVKIFSNGSGFTVSGDNSDPKDMSIKEAAYTLTNNYDVDPLDAPFMVLEAYPKDGVSNNSVKWCIEKKAAGGDYSRGASPYDIPNIGYNEVPYDGPKTEQIGSDAIIPAQGTTREDILKQVQVAADSGVKEIFDVSIMKTLVNTSRPEALLGDYTSTILKMMDRLCRMLFLGYVKEDDLTEQYGEDKYDEYMETIRNAMADLSELFVFISTRSVLADSMDTDGSDDLTDGNI